MTRPRTPPDQLNEIYPNLYLGDLTAAESPHVLEAYAITHIISLTSHRPKVPKGLGIVKKHFRIRDNTTSNLLSVLPECIERLEYILSDRDDGIDENGRQRRVLVHCRMGMSRSGGAVVAYVMKFAQCPATVALEYVRQMRPIVNPNRAFMAQLELWGACSYDTSFLEDHEKYVLADEKDLDLDLDVGGGGGEDIGEEALLIKALEMSMAADVNEDAGAGHEPPPPGVEIEALRQGEGESAGDVDMEENIPAADIGDSEPTHVPDPAPTPVPAPISAPADVDPDADTAMDEAPLPQPEDIPLPPPLNDGRSSSPSPDTATATQHLQQLEERRKSLREKHASDEKDDDGWGQVVMRDGMKRCFEKCLRDVGEGVEAVS